MNSEQTVIEYIGDKEHPSRADVLINGMPIKGITRISFEHIAGDIPEIVMDISGTEIEMNHQVKTLIESECAKVLIRRG
jgi:hypothetical protein